MSPSFRIGKKAYFSGYYIPVVITEVTETEVTATATEDTGETFTMSHETAKLMLGRRWK